MDRRAEARRRMGHQPHAAARGAQGAGRRGPGDDEGAPRRLRHRDVARRRVAGVPACSALLESDAAGEVAERASDAELDALQALHDRLEKQVRQRDAFFATNEAFHFKLLEVAGNRWRTQIVADLRKVMKLNRHHSLLKQGRIGESLAEHRALMRALDARDARRATQLMRKHFESGLEAAAG